MPTKVLLIHNYLSPYRVPLFTELAKCFDLDVWILGDIAGLREWKEEAPEGAFRWKRLPNIALGGNRYARLLLNPTLPFAIAREKPDVIICCGWDTPAVYYAAAWAKLRGIPFVLWAGSTAKESSALRTMTQAPVRWIVRRGDAWIAYGTRAKDYLAQLGADADRTECAFNTVDTTHVRDTVAACDTNALRVSLGLGDETVFMYCGNLLKLKGVDILLRAFAKADQANLKLLLVGSGEDRETFEALARDLGIQNDIIWTGYVEPHRVAEYYAIADALILPSRSEVWGLVVNEAMAAGVPVIVSDAAGVSADLVRDGENGFIFPSEDVDALASAIEKISNEDVRQPMCDAATNTMNAYTIEAMADAFERAVAIALDRHE